MALLKRLILCLLALRADADGQCGALTSQPPSQREEEAYIAVPRPWDAEILSASGGRAAGGVLISHSHVLTRASDLCGRPTMRRRKRLVYLRGLIRGDCEGIGA